jgi:sigma-E factor negative regulatory protein RseC
MTREKKERYSCSQGVVIRAGGRWATVEVDRGTMCGQCESKKACAPPLESRTKVLSVVENPLGAGKGDTVELSLKEGVLVWGSLMIYMIPMIFLIAFIMLALHLNAILQLSYSDPVISTVAGVVGFGLSLFVVRFVGTHWKYLADGRPRITRIIAHSG